MKTTKGTTTLDGYIPHRKFGPISAPVKVTIAADGPAMQPIPVTRDGRYVHALPGGGEVFGGRVSDDN